MAKILLIRTKSEKYNRPYGAPPLGLLYLSSILRQRYSHDVRILDMRADMLTPDDIGREFRSFEPQVVGISNFTVEAGCLHKITRVIKEAGSTCPVIVGGPHANACAADLKADPHIDFLVMGEGERTFPELVEYLLAGRKDFQDIQGIGYRSGGDFVMTRARPFIENLDELPFPDWENIDLEKYYRLPRFMPFIPQGGKPYLPIMTSRGCPYSCIYCHNILGKRFRARSAENIFAEMEMLHERHGVADFEFIDDCFNLDKKRVIALCDMIISSGLKLALSFPNGLRGDILDEEVITRLSQAGTKIISFAPETGSARLQKVIKKNIHLEKLQKMIAFAAGLGIHSHGFFMLGFPTETEEDLRQTLRFIAETKLHTADFFIVNMFPNTELYEQTRANGGRVPETFENIDYHDSTFNVSELTSGGLERWQRKFFLKFYLDGRRIGRICLQSAAIKKRYLFYYFVVFLKRVIFRRRES